MESLLSSFASSSSSLFSSLIDSTIQLPEDEPPSTAETPVTPITIKSQPEPTAPTPASPPQFHSPLIPLTPISIPRPPILASTPINERPNTQNDSLPDPVPSTQDLVQYLTEIRSVDGVDAVALARENDSLKSELVAARLQLEEMEREIGRLKLLLNPAPQQPNQQQLNQQQPNQQQPPGHQPPPQQPLENLQPYFSKKKRQRMRKKVRLEAAAAANVAATTLPPGCTLQASSSTPAPIPPPLPPSLLPLPPPVPTLFVFHDSNLRGVTAEELKRNINMIKKNNNTEYNINLYATYTLPQTFDKIKQTTFTNKDTVIINILTNDARNTKTRQRRTPDKCKQIQTQILDHLISFMPRTNITLLESPPLLNSPDSDIFPYNLGSFNLSRQYGTRFARTLIGDNHIWNGDGYHILRNTRHLLIKSIAAVAANVNAHEHFRLSRPPYGTFGPWTAPNGQGVMPLMFSQMATKQPLLFRQRSNIRPLIGLSVRRP